MVTKFEGDALKMPVLPEGLEWRVKLYESYLKVELVEVIAGYPEVVGSQDKDRYCWSDPATGAVMAANQIWNRALEAQRMSERLGVPVGHS